MHEICKWQSKYRLFWYHISFAWFQQPVTNWGQTADFQPPWMLKGKSEIQRQSLINVPMWFFGLLGSVQRQALFSMPSCQQEASQPDCKGTMPLWMGLWAFLDRNQRTNPLTAFFILAETPETFFFDLVVAWFRCKNAAFYVLAQRAKKNGLIVDDQLEDSWNLQCQQIPEWFIWYDSMDSWQQPTIQSSANQPLKSDDCRIQVS